MSRADGRDACHGRTGVAHYQEEAGGDASGGFTAPLAVIGIGDLVVGAALAGGVQEAWGGVAGKWVGVGGG